MDYGSESISMNTFKVSRHLPKIISGNIEKKDKIQGPCELQISDVSHS